MLKLLTNNEYEEYRKDNIYFSTVYSGKVRNRCEVINCRDNNLYLTNNKFQI